MSGNLVYGPGSRFSFLLRWLFVEHACCPHTAYTLGRCALIATSVSDLRDSSSSRRRLDWNFIPRSDRYFRG
jgi:hypothetical protein